MTGRWGLLATWSPFTSFSTSWHIFLRSGPNQCHKLAGWRKPWHLCLPLSGSHRMLLPASLYSIRLINNTGSHNASPIPRGAYGCWVWVNTIRLIRNSPSICVGSSILDNYDDRRRTITAHCRRQLPWKRISSTSAVFRILTSILSRHGLVKWSVY